MSAFFNSPLLAILIVLIWPAAKSAVFIGASLVSVCSRRPERRESARKVMTMISGRSDDRPE